MRPLRVWLADRLWKIAYVFEWAECKFDRAAQRILPDE